LSQNKEKYLLPEELKMLKHALGDRFSPQHTAEDRNRYILMRIDPNGIAERLKKYHLFGRDDDFSSTRVMYHYYVTDKGKELLLDYMRAVQ